MVDDDALRELQIDLADPESIKEKLPQIEGIVEGKRRIAAETTHDFEIWANLLGKLKAFTGLVIRVDEADDLSVSSPGRPSPAQDAVVGVVERENRAMRPMEVTEVLTAEGHEVASNNAVNAALYAAAQSGRLQRPGPRLYAPLPPKPTGEPSQ